GLLIIRDGARVHQVRYSTDLKQNAGVQLIRTTLKNVLWVDDHPAGNKTLIDELTSMGVTVTTAITNTDAASLMKGNNYDLIITDVVRDIREDKTVQNNLEPRGLAFIQKLGPSEKKKLIVDTREQASRVYGSDLLLLGVLEVYSNYNQVRSAILLHLGIPVN